MPGCWGIANRDSTLSILMFLFRIVETLRPRAWVMENVPALQGYVQSLSPPAGLRWADITRRVLNSADFGVPQRRFRFLAGQFPPPRPSHCSEEAGITPEPTDMALRPWRSMREVMDHLPSPLSQPAGLVIDPTYGIRILARNLGDHYYSTLLTPKQVERSRALKTHHKWCGRMRFPDNLDSPARTILATQIPSARETTVIGCLVGGFQQYRCLTVRECAAIQTFPIDYKFRGKSVTDRLRLVGNAVPPLLANAIAGAIKES